MTKLQMLASWGAILGTSVLAAYFFFFLIYHSHSGKPATGWFIRVIERHFAATIAVPLSAISSACIVLLLGAAAGGDLTFSVASFEFEGASSPVTLWLLCFLAMTASVRMLWNASSAPSTPASVEAGEAAPPRR